MIEIRITNNIGIKVKDYKNNTGATKTWIAEQIGITKQALDSIIRAGNPTIESLEKVAYVLQCDIKDLYQCHIIKDK